MKKSILGILVGFSLGIVLMLGLIFGGNMKPENEDVLAQEPGTNISEDVSVEETETLGEDSEFAEMEETELAEETEIPEESEVEEEVVPPETPKQEASKPTVTTPPVQPVEIPYYIRVNRQANCVTIYAKDAEGNYSVPVKAMLCSVGLTGETPLGTYSIYARYHI